MSHLLKNENLEFRQQISTLLDNLERLRQPDQELAKERKQWKELDDQYLIACRDFDAPQVRLH